MPQRKLIDLRLHEEYFLRSKQSSLYTAVLSAIVLTVFLKEGAEHRLAISVLCVLIFGLSVIRHIYSSGIYKHVKKTSSFRVNFYVKVHDVLTIISAVLWGVVIGVTSSKFQSETLNYWNIFILAGILSGSILSMSPRRNLQVVFGTLICSTFLFSKFLAGTNGHGAGLWEITFVTVLFLLFSFALGFQHFQKLLELYSNEFRTKQSNELLQSVIDVLPVKVALFDKDLVYTFVNKSIINELGAKGMLLQGLKAGSIYPDNPFVVELNKFVRSGANSHSIEVGLPIFRGEASRYHLVLYQKLNDGSFVTCSLDIHDLWMNKNELQKEKEINQMNSHLANLGEVAAGIAHEINNPLSIVTGYVELLEMDLQKIDGSDLLRARISKSLEAIKSGALRAASIVRSMKEMAKSGAKKETDIHELRSTLSELWLLVEAKMSDSNIFLSKPEVRAGLSYTGNALKVNQILLNLLWNSMDSLVSRPPADGGKILVSIEELDTELRIFVQDNGIGVPQEIVSDIMKPFFTTKESGLGIGLGISMAQAKQMNGTLQLTNARNPTVFCLTLKKAPTS